jgi:hypothetical protein
VGGILKRSAPLSLSNGLGMVALRERDPERHRLRLGIQSIPKGFAFEVAIPFIH